MMISAWWLVPAFIVGGVVAYAAIILTFARGLRW
jgi:hypothetical protein